MVAQAQKLFEPGIQSLEYSHILTLVEVFENQVQRTPNSLAIISETQSYSYLELDKLANQLARYLCSHGVGPGKFVGIHLDRSEKPILAILATLKTGAAYVPLGPGCPEERIKYIVDETGISLLLTEDNLFKNLAGLPCKETLLDDLFFLSSISSDPLPSSDTGLNSYDLCYIIFTSGSTGNPKGIMTEHRNVVSFIHAFNKAINITSKDRIYQGFALGFDGSVEEMWMAFSNGASLAIGNPTAAILPDEAARVMNVLRVTVFSTVPTFLGLIKQNIDTLRLIITSGEICPEKLVNLWVNDKRQMINVYGPTETTVNTTTKVCLPNTNVTIGKPLDGYHIYILDEQLKPIKPGEAGELYIGGHGVSRGYFKNDALSEKAFIKNPFDYSGSSKIFKTGDQVRLLPDGELEFLGRLDSQVKIRGFRVELREIESILLESALVENVVVTALNSRGFTELAAYVVPKCSNEQFDFDAVLDLLKKRVPAYMIPAYMDLLDEFPRLASGKISKKDLPPPKNSFVHTHHHIKPASNDMEQKLVAAWKKIFKLEDVSVTSDFFTDLGGYSLLAVEMVTLLREEYNLQISIRDVYHLKTIEAIANKMSTTDALPKVNKINKQTKSSKEIFHSVPIWERYSVYALQALVLIGFGVLSIAIFSALVWLIFGAIKGTYAISTVLDIFLAVMLLGYPFILLLSIGLKWLIIGRFKPGEYPLWSFYYFKFWFISQIQDLTAINLIAGTPVMSLYYKLMGAKVGTNTIIATNQCVIYDRVKIGSETSIGAETQLLGYRIENSLLKIGDIDIGDRCFIGDHCCLGLNIKMANDSNLGDLSLLSDNEHTKAHQSYVGSPAALGEVPLPSIPKNTEIKRKRRPFLYGLLHLIIINIAGLIFTLILVPLVIIIIYSYKFAGIPGVLAALVFDATFGVVHYCLFVALAKHMIMKKTPTGVFDTQSLLFIKKKLVDHLSSVSFLILHSLFTTIYLPLWLRLMGAKIGKRAEISTVTQMIPDLTTIGDESFLADGSMLSTGQFYRGYIALNKNEIGKRSFVGNNAILSQGKGLGDNVLLGVLSTPPMQHQISPDDSEWLGSPSFLLPFRKKITSFTASETFKPTLKLYAIRCIIDGLRIFLPTFIVTVSTTVFIATVVWAEQMGISFKELIVLLIGLGISIVQMVLLSIVVVKQILMGVFKPEIKPLWSVYIWLNELVNGMYETLASPIISKMIGTPFFNGFLRLMGCKIGKHAYIATTLFSEFDMVEIGDYANLNSGVVIQNHLFEDRVFKSSTVKIGNECSIGNMSIVLYDTVIKEDTIIGPLSLVMKGESLPEDSQWIGVPVSKQ